MTSNTAVAVPDTPAGGTADILVPMTAPSQPGNYSGIWRLRSPNGTLFGTAVSVKITISDALVTAEPTPTPTTSDTQVAALPTWTMTPSPTLVPSRTATPSPTPQATSTATSVSTTTLTRNSLTGTESGTVYVTSSGLTFGYGTMLAGDTSNNQLGKAYLGFDISDLGGKTIVSANLDLTNCTVAGTPFTNLGGVWVAELQYPVPLVESADAIPDTGIVLLNAEPTNTIDIRSFVQTRVSQRKTRFQIRLHPASANSDGDNKADYMACGPGIPKLTITYQ